MFAHIKPHVEKIHNIDAELAGHVGYINLTRNGRVCVGMAFLCLLCGNICQTLPLWSEL